MSFWQKTIGFLFCALFFLVPLTWLPNTSELFEFNKIILTYLLATLIVSAWICRMIYEKKFIFRRTPLDWPILVFLGSNILSLLGSIDIHTSWFGYYSRWNGGLLSLVSYSLLYWAFVSNMRRKEAIFSIRYSVFSAVIVAIYGSLEHFGFSPSCLLTRGQFNVDCWVQDVQNRVFATLGQPNWLAAYLVSLIFLPLSNLLNLKFKISNLLLFILIFTTLLFTKSRSGLLAFAISSLVFWGLIYFQFKSNLKQFLVLSLSFVFCVLTFAFLIPNPIRDLVTKTHNLTPKTSSGTQLEIGGTESGAIRKIVWTGATRIWTSNIKNFLIGTGPETFAMAYYQYRPVEHNSTSEWELLYNKAHNEFLNQLATTGLLGLLSYLTLLCAMAWNFKFLILNSKSIFQTSNFKFQIALFAGWSSILVTNFWGFSVVIVQLLLFLLPAITVVLEQESERVEEYKTSTNQMLAILFFSCSPALLLFYSIGKYWLADTKYSTAQNSIRQFQSGADSQYLIAAYNQFSDAFKLNSHEPAIASEYSVSAAYLASALHQNNATAAAQLAQQALSLSQLAISISPHHPNYYKSQARAAILLSDINADYLLMAVQALKKAQDISPTDPRIPYNLGVVYKYLGDATTSAKLMHDSLSLKPDFADAQKQLKEATTSSQIAQ